MKTLLLSLLLTMTNPTYSPDSSMIAFTRDNDLYVQDVASGSETRLTFDGSDVILNGYASWVYYEEILGRSSKYKAFWWSPDSRKIGFYRFDNSGVPVFPIFSPFGQDGSLKQTRYPKAGESNPLVRIGIIGLGDEPETVWADFEDDSEQYFGIPFWSADSRDFYIAREPRRQSVLDLYAVSAADGAKRCVYHEEYPTWLDWIDRVIFEDSGLYMARSFETGWEQIYFLSYDGGIFRRLSDGRNWDISLLKVDDRRGDVWFTAKRDSRIRPSLYRLDRKGRITPLTDPGFYVQNVSIADDGRTFTAVVSNSRTPARNISGSALKCDWHYTDSEPVVSEDRPKPQEIRISNDGFDLYGLVTYPRDFDPTLTYPVVMQLYGGPGTPYVRDIWKNRDASDQWCYENGIIYLVVDPRSSGENGRKGMDQAFRRMTVVELQDYLAWAEYLQSLPYVRSDRIGVEGFSFGGTTTAMLVLRYPEHFCCGVAGGGVYDWTLYDSHYTERFMDTPQANPEGYAEASVLTYVKPEIKGRTGYLKLTHGTGDDNVHFQNTLLLVDALQKCNVQFDLMIYPDGMHGYRGYQSVHDKTSDHLFWTRHLLADQQSAFSVDAGPENMGVTAAGDAHPLP